MAVLTKDEILKLIKAKELGIYPFDTGMVGPASVDLRLGPYFRTFEKAHDVFHLKEDADYRTITSLTKIKNKNYFLIMPGELVHGVTYERLSLPPYISGRIEGRSRFARVGLVVHLSSGFVQPGVKGRIVLEMVNFSPVPIALYPGTRICQIIFERTEGEATYTGKFNRQEKP